MRKKWISTLLAAALMLSMVPAVPASAVQAQSAGGPLTREIDEGLQAAIDAVVEPYISDSFNARAIPGAVVLVAKDGKIIAEKAYGYSYLTDPPTEGPLSHLSEGALAVNAARNEAASTEPENGTRVADPVPMTTDTLFDLASITKVMATTQAVMKLVSEGKIASVDDTVAKYIPEFAQNGKENVTLKQLLTHTSGLSQWEPDYLLFENDRQAVLDYYCTLPLTYPGGKNEEENRGKYSYSDINFRMLAYVVEAVSEKTIDEYVKTEIYEPLGLTRTTFKPLENGFTQDDCAATSWGDMYEMAMVDEVNLPGFSYDCSAENYAAGLLKRDAGELGHWRDYTLRGEVNDGNTALASGGVSGAAGLFSTASDLAVLGQLMLNGGVYNGVRIYDESVVDEFTTPRLTEEDQGYGFKLWWGFMGDKENDIRLGSTFGHDGFTGTQVWMDKDTNMTVVVLTNKMNVGSGISYSSSTGQYRPTFSNTLSNSSSNPAISPAVSYAIYDYFGGRDNMLSYTVKFDSNGGSTVDLQHVEPGQQAVEPEDPTRSGYTFAGWYTDSDFTTRYDFNTEVSGNITLYAKWNALYLTYEIDEGLQAAIDAVVEPYISDSFNDRAIPGAVVLVAKDGKIIAEKAYGYSYLTDPPTEGPLSHLSEGALAVNAARNEAASTEPENGTRVADPVPMTTDTLFDLASITKVMATTQAVMKLVSEGKIASVDDTVAKYIPEFAQNGKENVTLKQLLTHTSGLSQWEPDYLLFENDRQAVLDYYCTLPLTYPGGKNEEENRGKYSYSDINFRMLAYVVEAVSEKTIDEYVKTEIYEPLGLTRTTFKPLENGFTQDDCAATSWGDMYEMAMVDEVNLPGFSYDCSAENYAAGLLKRDAGELGHWRDYTLRGEVNDGNTALASGGVSGAAGLFSTASDLAVLGQLMLNGGVYNGVRIYDESVVDEFTTPRLTEEDQGYGFKLWWGFMGDKENDIRLGSTFGHDGFTGTQVWMDKDTNMTVVVLTNKMNVGSGISYSSSTGQYRPTFSNTLSNSSSNPAISPAVSYAIYDYFGGRDNMLSYTVKFDSNGGSTVDLQHVEPGQQAVEPEDPTRSGYTFAGWYTDSDFTTRYDFNAEVSGNITLYAKWESEYVPTPGGGSSTTTETVKNEDGSTTKIVTDKKTGTVTETTTWPDGTVITTTTPKDGTPVSNVTVPAGKDEVTVTIPTAEPPTSGQVAVIVNEDGSREIVKTSVATEDGLRVTLTESAKLEIMDNSKHFSDVDSGSWSADAIQFVASRELFQGTSDSMFSPAGSMTRGMLMTVLARLSGQDTTGGETWYSVGMEWAKKAGISDGTAPEANVTREQLAVMLYRFAGAEGGEAAALTSFPDNSTVSSWAQDAMGWAVQNGIITGTGSGTLNPAGNASRAEVAVMLQRFISL